MSILTWPYPGSRWWKFDFHTHTPASMDYGKGPDQASIRKNTTPRDWLLAQMRSGIDCVAVTDHNTGAWMTKLTEELKVIPSHPEYRPLVLFPGVEISANEGIHILAIFDPEATEREITLLLGACGWNGTEGEGTHVTDKSAWEVVEEIRKARALAILAHVDEAKTGAFERLSGPTFEKLLQSEGVAAIELCDPQYSFPSIYQHQKEKWPQVLGSDAHHLTGSPGQRYPGSHFTWIKMAQPTLEGLRLALLDGEGISVRRSDAAPFDPFQIPEHFLEEIKIENMRFMGRGAAATLQLSPFFNALIGGRGTGKSTVVHASRLVLRREGELLNLDEKSEARRSFERFNSVAGSRNAEGGLLKDTTLSVTFSRDGVRHRLHWRQGGQEVAVEEEGDEGWQPSESQELTPERFPVRIFSQGQIASLAGERHEALLDLIDEAAGAHHEKNAIEEARRRYFTLCSQIRELEAKIQGREGLKVQLEDVTRKLKRFEDAHHAKVLKDYQIACRQKSEVNRQFARARELANGVRRAAEELELDELPPAVFNSETDVEVLEALTRLAEHVRKGARELKSVADSIDAAAASEEDGLSKTAWQRRMKEAFDAYDALKQGLQDQGIEDPSEYGRLVQEKQRLEKELKRIDELEKANNARHREAEAASDELRKARRALSAARQNFLLEKLSSNPFVKIEILPLGRDEKAIEDSLREMLGAHEKYAEDIYVSGDGRRPSRGLVAEILADLPVDTEAATEELYARIDRVKEKLIAGCGSKGNLGAWFQRFLADQIQKRPEFLDRIRSWFPEDSLRIEYSRRGDGKDFQPITQASAGQRAAAMLAFLLAYGHEPLILDQPEDDLDNHLIYDLVVRQICENKIRRQLIVVTHNPNIVVNGDAEMLHALDFRGGQCVVQQSGSLQDLEMREEVCRVMEGGREAFNRRYRRLGRKI